MTPKVGEVGAVFATDGAGWGVGLGHDGVHVVRQEVEGEVGVEDPGGGGGVQLGVVLLPVLAVANHAGTLEEGATLPTTC